MIQLYQLLYSGAKMSSNIKTTRFARNQNECEPRRSSRQRKEPKNEDYFMGSTNLEDIFGQDHFQEDYSPKKRRRHYRYDDSEDYSQGHKCTKKSKQINVKKVEGLLEWKYRLEMLPITVNSLPQEQQAIKLDNFHRVKYSKNVRTEPLAALGEDIQAIFINIDWGKKGQQIDDFQHLKIQSNKLMSKGLVFVWTPKQHVSELLSIMEKKDFIYVENFQIINFDIEKAKLYSRSQFRQNQQSNSSQQDKKEARTQIEDVDLQVLVKSLENVDPSVLIADEKSQFFNISKRTLLMFKKNSTSKFELRHQRTCDVVFDMPLRLGQKCDSDLKSYIYNMIETLLPDCLTVNQLSKSDFDFKMMELWADKGEYRRGWISVVQE